MFVVIAYDISDPKRLNKVAKVLKGYGARVQKSVFEVYVDKKVLKKIKQEVELVIDFHKDTVRYYRLCKVCAGTVEYFGSGFYTEEEGSFSIL
jgi:CRISPR-associated protein Cas2